METALEIVEDEETRSVNTLKSTLQTLPPLPTECCIYRVPYELRRVNEEAYTPMLVSIGPFHHSKESLQEMEVHKERYLQDFLKRSPNWDLERYFRSLKELEARARNCYSENIRYLSNDFIKMMLLDGCFIVEFSSKYWHRILRNKDDPIFKSEMMVAGIIRDMVSLENQLPFFILEHLFDQLHGLYSLNVFALNMMHSLFSNNAEGISLHKTTYPAKHMVDLCLQYHTHIRIKSSRETNEGISSIPHATRLHESGVTFTKRTGSGLKSLLDVKFTNGNFEIPAIVIEDSTEHFMRNLIAYEQCDSMGNDQFFSSYVLLMDCLIDTPNDVELLRKAGIIDSLLGDNKEVSQIFNKLGTGVICGLDSYLQGLFEDVNDYSNIRWHGWRAKLQRNCFNTPWRSLSVATEAILLILTFMQTVCSFLQLKG